MSSRIAAMNAGRQRVRSISSMRSMKRPSGPAAAAAKSAENAWPRCRYPVGLGAKRVTGMVSATIASGNLRFHGDYVREGGSGMPVYAFVPVWRQPSMTLSGPRRPAAASGPARQLVVLLHGLGADGTDLIELAGALAPVLPHA